jgi:hypothetical protein
MQSKAAQDAVNLLKQRAATLWRMKPEDIVYQDGVVSARRTAMSR